MLQRYEMKYEGWIENYSFSEIRYKILIRRKPLFVIQNCVIPVNEILFRI
jgi:hypothetical protein